MDDTIRMVAEHARGATYREIGKAHHISHETARQIILREGRRYIDGFDLGLLLAWKYEQQGRPDEAEWPTLLVPFQNQEDWQLALALLQFTVDQLRDDRGLDVHVRTTPTPNGSAFMLTLENPPWSAR